MTLLMSDACIVFGSLHAGSNVLIEPGAVVGRPLESEVQRLLEDRVAWGSLEALYQDAAGETRLGEGVMVRSGAVVYSTANIGAYAEVGHHCVVREGVQIGEYTRLLPHTSIRKNVRIAKGCRIAGIVGDNSQISEYVTSMGQLVHDYKVGIGGEVEEGPRLRIGCVVGRGAVVVGGIEIGDFAIVAAGSIVRIDVPPMAIVAGNPARIVGQRKGQDVARVQERVMRGSYL